MRIIVFCDDQTTGGILIQPMHDAGPSHATNTAQLSSTMMQQCIDERMFLMASGGVNDQPRWFVQHQKGLVLVQNIQRHFFGLGLRRAGFGPMNLNLFARARGMSRLDRVTIHTDMAFLDEPLDCTARNRWKLRPQECIQPFGRECFIQNQNFGAGGHDCQETF